MAVANNVLHPDNINDNKQTNTKLPIFLRIKAPYQKVIPLASLYYCPHCITSCGFVKLINPKPFIPNERLTNYQAHIELRKNTKNYPYEKILVQTKASGPLKNFC